MNISQFIANLDENQKEFFNERAAVREYEGRMDPFSAELCAMDDTIRYFGLQSATDDSFRGDYEFTS